MTQNEENEDRAIPFAKGLEYLNKFMTISDAALYKLCDEQKIPHLKPNGRNIQFVPSELRAWFQAQKIKVTKPQTEIQG